MLLHYRKLGSGPNLIILHGLYGSGDNWFNIGKRLSEHFTVYLIDQRNHGSSPHFATHSYEEMTNDLKSLVVELKLAPFNLIGHSMGGKTAMTYTLQHGSDVTKLINVDISPYSYIGLESFRNQYQFHQSVMNCFLTAPIKGTKNRSEIESHFSKDIQNKQVLLFLLKNLKRSTDGFEWKLNTNTIYKHLENIIDAAPPVKLGAQSYVDTLFIRGGKSPYITDNDIEGIADIFPNASFLTYVNSGHWLHAEETERFIEDVKHFLL